VSGGSSRGHTDDANSQWAELNGELPTQALNSGASNPKVANIRIGLAGVEALNVAHFFSRKKRRIVELSRARLGFWPLFDR
jgi:hypothetical protein